MKSIKDIYDNGTFYDFYGGSIFITFICCLIMLFIIIHIIGIFLIDYVSKDWDNKKCKPPYLLLAGFIDKQKNKTNSEIIKENYNTCLEKTNREVIKTVEEPIQVITNNIDELNKNLKTNIDDIGEHINAQEKQSKSYINSTSDFLKFIASYVQKIVSSVKDGLYRIVGVYATSIYMIEKSGDIFTNSIYLFRTLLTIFISLLITFIIFNVGSIVLLFLGLQFPQAITMVIILGMVIAFMSILLGISIPAQSITTDVINLTACFTGDTYVEKNNGTFKHMKDIIPGDILKNNNRVTSTFIVMKKKNQKLINYNGIVLTPEHRIIHNDKYKETSCLKHINATNNDTYLYCINTEFKYIDIGKDRFVDWDDLDKNELKILQSTDIHKSYHGGFHELTLVHLTYGKVKYIKDLLPGDITHDNNVIFAVVKILAKDLDVYVYDDYTIHSSNIKSNHSKITNKYHEIDYLYHVVTSSRKIRINNTTFYDFDMNIESYLKKNKT